MLDGLIGRLTLNNYSIRCFIIGIDHNSDVEGTNRIHFLIGETTSFLFPKDICLYDNFYDKIDSASNAGFVMNKTLTNSGGWENSYMRNFICGTSLSNYYRTFIGAISTELRTVLKPVAKYTDNTGGSSETESKITKTTDYSFLLSEFEVYGKASYSNRYEARKQKQYSYYSAGNSKLKRGYSDQNAAYKWWLRSVQTTALYEFLTVPAIKNAQNALPASAYVSYGFAPAFCV